MLARIFHTSCLRSPASGPRSARGGTLFSVLAVLGCFAIFLLILWLAYLPQRRPPPSVDLSTVPQEERWRYTPEGRKARLEDLRARERAEATSYGWIDRGKGVVRLPIDRAVQLTILELNSNRGK